LYAAADFYDLDPLKQVCSEILSDGLCATSALGVLSMADLHQDQQLKSAALDFISLNDKDIIGTKDWTKFGKDNGNLALETLRELYCSSGRIFGRTAQPGLVRASPVRSRRLFATQSRRLEASRTLMTVLGSSTSTSSGLFHHHKVQEEKSHC
ncbi:hypothetical protein JTE90_019780, partial [Oedothorax gibbosus]